jgi:hypothetical protein
MYRWLKEKPVKSPNAKSGLPSSIVSETVKNVPVPNGPVNLDGIPVELVQAMGVRVLAIAKGEGLDKVEDAIVLVAGAIAGRAEDIAKGLLEPQTETETSEEKTRTDQSTAAMNAVNALGKLTDCLNRINASRVLWSMAHRNFAEGDLLSGQGRKYDAEAATILQEARANGARDITPTAPGDFDDAEAEDEAMAALRDVEGTK